MNGRLKLGSFDKHELLRAHPFFSGWDDDIIEQLVPHALMRKVKKGTVLFRKGDTGTNLYAVCSGAVRISASSDQGKDAVFNLIVPGEIFGEIAFLDGGQRTADAVVSDDGELMVIERRDFIPLLKKHPQIAIKLIEILCSRLRRTSLQVEDIVFFDVQVRLAKTLLDLHRQNAAGAPNAFIPITQREISQLIGASREYTNRELQNWQRRKWLKLKRAGVAILAPDELRRLIPDSAG
jgi:CRP/FNR family transcriptional regulator, cyclic AMP receptor protein